MSLLLLSLLVAASSTDGDETRIMVVRLDAAAPLLPIAAHLTERILIDLDRRPNTTVISQAEIELVAAQFGEQLEDCLGAEACARRLEQLTNADKILTGRVAKWGDEFVVTLNMVDVERSVVQGRDSATGPLGTTLLPSLHRVLDGLVGTASTAAPSHTALGAGTKVAVLALRAFDTDGPIADSLTELLALELDRIGNLDVISQREVTLMLDYEAQKQIARGENNVEDLIEIANALGVDFLVTGSVGPIGGSYVINLKLIDCTRARVSDRISETFEGPPDALPGALRNAVRALLNRPANSVGSVEIVSSVPASAKVDGGPLVAVPSVIDYLADGRHALEVRADGHVPLLRDFYIDGATRVRLRAELTPLSSPWYSKWWTWAIAGTVVAAVVTTAWVASSPPSNGMVVPATPN